MGSRRGARRWWGVPWALLLIGACGGGLNAGGDAGGGDEGVHADSGGSTDAADGFFPGDTTSDASGCTTATSCLAPPDLAPCERVVCVAGACGRAPRDEGSPCDDGDRCTLGTRCYDQVCGGGTALACADANPCTADLCDPLTGCKFDPKPELSPCSDGDPCTLGDRCEGGQCEGTGDPACTCAVDDDCAPFDSDDLCAGHLVCDAQMCRIDPASVVSCPAPGPCRASACDPETGACTTLLLGDDAPCDDSNPCTASDRCSAGVCVGSTGACPCDADADCAEFVGASYDFCQGPLRCIEGACAPDASKAVVCEGGGAGCLTEVCEPSTGLCAAVARADGTACASEVPCTASGACAKGVCVTGAAGCDDGNPCTADSCAGAAGCEHTPIGGACDDGNPCTASDSCADGACVGGPAPACDDLEPCTVDTCEPSAGGCVFTPRPDGAPCQGADLCLEGGTCQGGYCGGGAPVECAASGPCVQALCKPDLGCTTKSLADGAPCDDGDPCTQAGQCAGGACDVLPVPCKDGNPCTVDACDSQAGGCVHTPTADGATCDPPNPCMTGGSCTGGECGGGTAVVCPPLPCRVSACDEATGACKPGAPLPDGTPCDAGLCSAGATCSAGTCSGGAGPACDDADACTLDTCDPKSGACTYAPKPCPEPAGDACRDASCDAAAGCDSTPSPLCADGFVLLSTSFPCEGASAWTAAPAPGPPVLAVGQTTGPVAPWDGDCSLGAQVPPTLPGPWETAATTSEFAAGQGFAGPATVRVTFVELLNTQPEAAPTTRAVALTAGDATAVEVELPPAPQGLNAGWQQRQVFLPLPAGAKADGLRFRLAGSAKSGPMLWRIDKLVAVSIEPPAP
ncbi:MAG: hypothetical protein R3F39_26055 [Myxococcota bacterium]